MNREAFEKALASNPLDDTTRLVYADWLEEHDQLEEADRQRQWRKAYDRLCEMAPMGGQTCLNYGYGEPSDNWRDITVEDLIKAGYLYTKKQDWFVQSGSEQLRSIMRGELLEEYWQCWEIVTGEKRAEKETYSWDKEEKPVRPSPFSCSC